jgi:hypothetical protein
MENRGQSESGMQMSEIIMFVHSIEKDLKAALKVIALRSSFASVGVEFN